MQVLLVGKDFQRKFVLVFLAGNLIARHREIFSRNPLFLGMRLPDARELDPIERRYPHLSPAVMDIIKVCRYGYGCVGMWVCGYGYVGMWVWVCGYVGMGVWYVGMSM